MKNAQQRLAALPYHIIVPGVWHEDPIYDRLIDSINWLYDDGPQSTDWFVHQYEDGVFIDKKNKYQMYPRKTTAYTFAFRNRNEAALFKLLWFYKLKY